MPADLKPRSHAVKKGETIQSIAKKYGFRDWKEVWKHPGNDKLRKTRKDGEGLAPGDTVTVPALNEDEREERSAAVREHAAKAGEALKIARQLDEAADVFDEQAKKLDAEASRIGADYDALAKEIGAVAADCRKKSLTADIVGKAASFTVAASSAWKEAGKSMGGLKTLFKGKIAKATGTLGKSIGGGVGGILAIDGVKNALEAAGVLEKDHVDEVEILTAEIGRLWYNITSPTFYGNAVATLIEGGSWSDAVTADVQNDLKASLAKVMRDKKVAVDMVKAAADRARGRATKLRSEAVKVIKGVEKLKV